MAKRRGQVLDGVLLLDKPSGLSSNHALQRAKRTVDAAKAGHTGTLDPFATGLLLCCMGRATKISSVLLNANKAYEATVAFGVETDSADLTGNVVARAPDDFIGVKQAALEQVLLRLTGVQSQVPPMYSALKRDGKPLYTYARAGIELKREPRTVTLYRLDLVSIFDNAMSARINIVCSKGTYIRTLAQDIGRALGCFAHLSALRRTEIGPFSLVNAITLHALQSMSIPAQALLAINKLPAVT